ncbi:hypothetical protein niasHT_035002 [Heterodera trifolii]|uniref:Secreted protein n=1 Tax=Heterodera trifolii TaxID=157864 RepID=A0ABD2I1F4_9BILA
MLPLFPPPIFLLSLFRLLVSTKSKLVFAACHGQFCRFPSSSLPSLLQSLPSSFARLSIRPSPTQPSAGPEMFGRRKENHSPLPFCVISSRITSNLH